MSDGITITLDAEGQLRARLGNAIAGLSNPQPLLDHIGMLMVENIEIRFATKRDPAGQRWAALKPSTRKAYERKYNGKVPGSLLERTVPGMRESLTHNVEGDHVDVGFRDRVAIYHEFGTRRMVSRGLLTDDPSSGTLGAQDRQDILDEISAYLAELL